MEVVSGYGTLSVADVTWDMECAYGTWDAEYVKGTGEVMYGPKVSSHGGLGVEGVCVKIRCQEIHPNQYQPVRYINTVVIYKIYQLVDINPRSVGGRAVVRVDKSWAAAAETG